MTAAYNEGGQIEKTLQSVAAQTVTPKRWVIVSDGSTDETDAIVQNFQERCHFIRFLRVERSPGHSFRSKVVALHRASKLLDDISFSFIGNVDADVTVSPSYFQDLLERFRDNPKLGLAGGSVCEEMDGEFQPRRINRSYAVAHAAQLVRRECYDAIGGYQVLEYGGEDWHARISAQMTGWQINAFPDLPIYHHRHTGTGTNPFRTNFRLGRLDYSFGSDPIFELMKCSLQFKSRPVVIGGLVRLLGFMWSCVQREKRPVSEEFISFLRAEQSARITAGLHRILRFTPNAKNQPSSEIAVP